MNSKSNRFPDNLGSFPSSLTVTKLSASHLTSLVLLHLSNRKLYHIPWQISFISKLSIISQLHKNIDQRLRKSVQSAQLSLIHGLTESRSGVAYHHTLRNQCCLEFYYVSITGPVKNMKTIANPCSQKEEANYKRND